MKGKIKKVSTAIALISIGVIVGIAMPIVVKGENGDATSAQVLAGKTFTSSLVSVATSGEMKNLSGKTFATNNPGVSTIDVDDGYYTEIQVDASEVYQAGVTAGAENTSKNMKYETGTISYGTTKSFETQNVYALVSRVNVSDGTVHNAGNYAVIIVENGEIKQNYKYSGTYYIEMSYNDGILTMSCGDTYYNGVYYTIFYEN